ncbi:MAG: KGG domain-containing protein [Brevundimonas sp.]|uniref:KGG domain-containing protein n=1 Tax=Brevundimonas sp. TaxID=1871086 RepID=UPI0024884451|nr:KGG domain-containing protein [Brevundimonas sp.]MDI1327346.1 KGG domain-containing protein [Brevundimonas sp.]
MTDVKSTGRPRGFAAMSPELRRSIAAKGGASVAPERRTFSKDSNLARAAGQKGGRSRGDKSRG